MPFFPILCCRHNVNNAQDMTALIFAQVKTSKYGPSIIDIITSHMPLRRRMLPSASQAAPAAAASHTPAVASAAEAAVCAEPPAATSQTLPAATVVETAVAVRLQARAGPPSPPWGKDEDGFFTLLGGGVDEVLGEGQAGSSLPPPLEGEVGKVLVAEQAGRRVSPPLEGEVGKMLGAEQAGPGVTLGEDVIMLPVTLKRAREE